LNWDKKSKARIEGQYNTVFHMLSVSYPHSLFFNVDERG